MNEIFEEFQEFRKILCVCPCCGDLVRVSDLKLKVKGPSAPTWLDEYETMRRVIGEKIGRFEEKKHALKEKATEKGRKEAEKAINKAIPAVLKSLKLDPFDVKPILNPVDFVVFKGMTKKENEIDDILMLSKQVTNPQLNKIREQVKKAILSNMYEWQVARITEEGNITFE